MQIGNKGNSRKLRHARPNQFHSGVLQMVLYIKKNTFCFLTPLLGSGSLATGHKIHICDKFSWVVFICLTLFFQGCFDKLHNFEGMCSPTNGSSENSEKGTFQLSKQRVLGRKNATKI